jgi:hypothetical protein
MMIMMNLQSNFTESHDLWMHPGLLVQAEQHTTTTLKQWVSRRRYISGGDNMAKPKESVLVINTKRFIDNVTRRTYAGAIQSGAALSEVEYAGVNMYNVSVGLMSLTYMGTVDGKAKMVGAEGSPLEG